jgi:hypothetical protein
MTTGTEPRSGLFNRVDPWGKLHDAPERGAWMGNRGILHDDQKQVVKQWQHHHWKTCLLEYGESTRKGNTARDRLFTKNHYSELFFLDEATAFAAGHRPCAQCRYQRYREFIDVWLQENSNRVPLNPPIEKIDEELRKDRLNESGGKRTYPAEMGNLPPGTIIEMQEAAFLKWRGRLYRWSFGGYEPYKAKIVLTREVRVLTPESIVRTFAAGFIPHVHESAYW